MTTPSTIEALFEQIRQIQSMEHGSLSVIGQGPKGPYYNLNSWEDGKNQCRYVPSDKLADVRQAIAGYRRYQQLTRQYADLVIAETRQNIAASKKKKSPITSSWPKMRKSSK